MQCLVNVIREIMRLGKIIFKFFMRGYSLNHGQTIYNGYVWNIVKFGNGNERLGDNDDWGF